METEVVEIEAKLDKVSNVALHPHLFDTVQLGTCLLVTNAEPTALQDWYTFLSWG